MSDKQFVECWMMYVGARQLAKDGIGHEYIIIKKPHSSDLSGMPGYNLEDNTALFKKRLLPRDTVGWIRPAKISEDGQTVSSDKKSSTVHGWKIWYNKSQIAGWEALDKAAKATQAKLKDIGKDELLTLLQPLHSAMREATREQKRLIIAEVLLILNS